MKINKILIAGEGGQGIQLIAKVLAEAAHNSGAKVTYLPNFGVEQRGGVSLAFLQLSDSEIPYPKFQEADVIVILATRAINRIKMYVKKETLFIFDDNLISEDDMSVFKNSKISIPATFFAKEKLIPKVFNIIILGALLAEVGGIKIKKVEKALNQTLLEKYRKEPQLKHFNLKALEIGYDILSAIKKEEKWREKILNQ